MIIPCPGCRRDVDSPYEHIGRKVRCPLCGTAFTVSLPRVIPLAETQVPGSDESPAGQACGAGSGLNEFVQGNSHLAPPAAPVGEPAHEGSGLHGFVEAAPRPAQAARLPSVGWHVMTPKGWIGPMHIVQVARAAWTGKIGRTTLLHHDEWKVVIQAGSLRGIFPREPAAARRPAAPAPQASQDVQEADPCEALAVLGGAAGQAPAGEEADPAAALEQLASK